ncbi:MAG: methyltransferase domain-containing protein [Zetaproteobacteria bacterium]|nr:MAG: methyltransferase domain-containing protein [Zetaproteobacteria bacterium]
MPCAQGSCLLDAPSARLAAVRLLDAVLARRQRADVGLARLPAPTRALAHEIVYGVLRRYFSLEVDVSRFLREKPEPVVRALLLAGAYQLRYMRMPAYAVVHAMVDVCKAVQPRAKGLVNAVLRRVAESEPPARLKPYQRAELPRWLYAAWRDQFGAEQVRNCARWLREKPLLSVAVPDGRENWMRSAERAGFACERGALSPLAVTLAGGTAVESLPGYTRGEFLVMDQAAQLAVLQLPVRAHDRVLDLCAAPGGKSALLARLYPQAEVLAVDRDARRLPRLRDNLRRMRATNVRLVHADARALPLPDAAVNTILLDAPCTASGILRRHPDAKFLHDAGDVRRHAVRQRAMMQEAWRVLRPGGFVLYAVCSIHRAENEDVIAGQGEVVRMRRLLPARDHDGFFFALLRKPA